MPGDIIRVFLNVRLLAVLLLAALPLTAFGVDKTKASEKPKAVKVTVDDTETPELKEWTGKAKALVEKWHPLIADLLKSDGFRPADNVKLVFKKEMKGIAYTSGQTITISAHWVKAHPDDWGMVVHELTHVIQAYPGEAPSWLTEGIADYIRYFHYEPKTPLGPVDPRKDTYKDGYGTAARFLAWVEQKHDKEIVKKLNAALRRKQYHDKLFVKYTGKNADQLWDLYLATLR
jgi:hypothetical protein